MKKRCYHKPDIDVSEIKSVDILAASDKVGELTDSGSNASKEVEADLWEKDDY